MMAMCPAVSGEKFSLDRKRRVFGMFYEMQEIGETQKNQAKIELSQGFDFPGWNFDNVHYWNPNDSVFLGHLDPFSLCQRNDVGMHSTNEKNA
jgi:hypothetical protein